jgi:glycosyltransferase involved in cell wall biosynthesis
MRINFILTGSGHRPVGGFKVIYEYANRLTELGNTVTVVHPANVMRDAGAIQGAKKLLRYAQRRADRSFLPRLWFEINSRVSLTWVPNLNERYIPDADIVVATGAPTAEWVNKYPVSKGVKYYFLQHYESWDPIGLARLRETYAMPLKKIAISRWLCEIADELGDGATYIPNGLDNANFYVEKSIDRRNPSHGIMLYHVLPEKGIEVGLAACELARKKIPDLTITMFGVYKQPSNLPSWIKYIKNPGLSELRRIYNEASFVVAPSTTEGWGLVPCEGMMCGCALIATDAGGHLEFALHQNTALVSPVRNVEALGASIAKIITDHQLRRRLSEAGRAYLNRYTWDASARRLNEVFGSGANHV